MSCPAKDTGYAVANTKTRSRITNALVAINAHCVLQESQNRETEPRFTSLRWINTIAFATIMLRYLGHQAISKDLNLFGLNTPATKLSAKVLLHSLISMS